MSGNQPPEPPDPDARFPVIGDYTLIPGPGDPGYVDDQPVIEDVDLEDLDDGDPIEEEYAVGEDDPQPEEE